MSTNDLLGIAEIADLAKVSKQAVTNWRSRYSNFPQPVQSGPVWIARRWKLGKRTYSASLI
jgi:chromosome partitioning protein